MFKSVYTLNEFLKLLCENVSDFPLNISINLPYTKMLPLCLFVVYLTTVSISDHISLAARMNSGW